ncbi:hypothetical protein [Streptomyces sp. NBC_00316]|uniref:hypothetical protein n=1 Tax=Streptomyces sp. NBC_00316 TaxID=2975710 RepID=UPI002E2B3DCA|nr:hypothetical protein [Streptomyces sp. NBC_00316]
MQHPYEKAADEPAAKPAGGTVGPGRLQSAFLAAVYDDGFRALRAATLSACLEGDPRPLTDQAAPRPEPAPMSPSPWRSRAG